MEYKLNTKLLMDLVSERRANTSGIVVAGHGSRGCRAVQGRTGFHWLARRTAASRRLLETCVCIGRL